MFAIQCNGIGKLVLVLEQFLSCIVVVFYGECKSWNLAMVGSNDWMVWENGGIWFYKMEVPKGWEGVLIERTKFFF